MRKIDKAIDFSFIYECLEPLYSNIGRPSIDPVILFKLAFLDRLDNRHSMKKTCEEAQVNLAYRWYLGIDLDEKIPHYSDFSKNYPRKYSKEIEIVNSKGEKEMKTIFRIIFEKILEEAMGRGFIDATHIYMDSTHIKANANKKKVVKKIVEAESKFYQEELEKEIDQLCEENGFKKAKSAKTVVRHIWQNYLDEAELIRHTEYHQRYYRLRSLTIERVFADAKEKHGIRYTRRKGRKRVQDEILLVFACMNLKKMALWMAKPPIQESFSTIDSSLNLLKTLCIQFINKKMGRSNLGG